MSRCTLVLAVVVAGVLPGWARAAEPAGAAPARTPEQAAGLARARELGLAGKYPEAAAAYRQVIALGDDCDAIRELAWLVTGKSMGSVEEARQLLDKAIATGCARGKDYLKAAQISELLDGPGAKVDSYVERAYAVEPTNVDAAKRWGGILERSGRWEEAIKVYFGHLRTEPANAEFRYFIAGTFAREGKCEEALMWFDAFLNYAFAHPKIADATRKSDAFKKCLPSMEKKLADLEQAEKLRAEALAARVRKAPVKEIAALYGRATELAPEWVILMRECAQVYEETGDVEDAKRAIFLNDAFARKAPASKDGQEAAASNVRLRALVAGSGR